MEDKGTIYGLINKAKSAGKEFGRHSALYANNICELLDFSEKNYNGYEYSTVWINKEVRESEQFNNLYKIAQD